MADLQRYKKEQKKIQLTGDTNVWKTLYGTDTGRSFGYFAVKKFLDYSGRLYYGRAGIRNTSTTYDAVKASVEIDDAVTSGQLIATIEALTEGEDGNNVSVKFTKLEDVSGVPTSYTVEVLYNGISTEIYRNVNFDENSDDFIEDAIAGKSGLIDKISKSIGIMTKKPTESEIQRSDNK